MLRSTPLPWGCLAFQAYIPYILSATNPLPPVLQFKITLLGVMPPVWRRIQVPAGYSFWDLHVAIQDAMGWQDVNIMKELSAEGGTVDQLKSMVIGLGLHEERQ